MVGQQLFRCNSCSYESFRLHHLKRHTRIHTGERPYSCEKCSVTFSRVDALQLHRKTHAKEDSLVCSTCGFAALSEDQLLLHDRIHQNKCSFCDLVAPSVKTLRLHERTHRLFKCRHCAYSSVYEKRIYAHERSVHSGTVKYLEPITSTKMHDCPKITISPSLPPREGYTATHLSDVINFSRAGEDLRS